MKQYIIFLALIPHINASTQSADSVIIQQHLTHITKHFPNRNPQHMSSLDSCAAYIYTVFSKYGDSTVYQTYGDNGMYKNVITSFGPLDAERIIVGAHYDVCGNQEGADDNASGVVGLLELARLLDTAHLNRRIDLVAYTLEEPPYFRTQYMGSYVHANYLYDQGIAVEGMICLEMIGYFDESKKSQHYPLKLLRMFYGSKGDYITYVKKTNGGKMPRKFKRSFRKNKQLRTKYFTGPANLTGIDFSDHLNYWKFGFEAVMITNTGFYRNPNYHEPTDRLETLNISKMTAVIQQVYDALIHFQQ